MLNRENENKANSAQLKLEFGLNEFANHTSFREALYMKYIKIYELYKNVESLF